jgi:DNA polymerase-1
MTNAQSYIDLAHAGDILHANINTLGARRTHRQSSSNPNLQNVAKEMSMKNPYPIAARECFGCKPGYVQFFFDYAGIEACLIADWVQETEMLDIIARGDSIHDVCAPLWYAWEGMYERETDPKKKKVLRDAGKNASFATPYGCTMTKAAATLNLSFEAAQLGWRLMHERFPRYCNFTVDIIKSVKKDGYIQSRFGPKLYVPLDKAYSGANYIIQHMAAKILKRAEIKVDKYLKDEWNNDIRLVLPVHDELIFDYPRKLLKYQDAVLHNISELMCDQPEIKVKLRTETKCSTTVWSRTSAVEVI